jgi:hypothetical protein
VIKNLNAGFSVESHISWLTNVFVAFMPTLYRVARWFVFKPKLPIWVNFGGPLNGKCRYIL